MGKLKPHICSYYRIYHQLSSFITVYQIFGPYLSRNFVKFLLSIFFTFCIGKRTPQSMCNGCKLNYYHHICHIIVVYGTFMDILQSKTNHCNSIYSLIKKVSDLVGYPSL